MFLSNSSTDISNAKFSTINECVVHLQNVGNSSKYVKTTNCRFVGFLKNGVFAKRDLGALNLSAFEVQNCVFDDNALSLGSKAAVLVSSESPTSG